MVELIDVEGVSRADVLRQLNNATAARVEEIGSLSVEADELIATADPDQGGPVSVAVEAFEFADEAAENLRETDIRVAGDELTAADLKAFAEAGLDSNRTFVSRQNDRVSLTLYRTANGKRTEPVEGVPTIEFEGGEGAGPVADFLRNVREYGPMVDPAIIGRNESLQKQAEDRDIRRETRQAGREAAEAAGVDLDEFAIDARADGEVIVQDRDTGRTRTIDADAWGGVGSALDAATGDGQFVADDADPAASGSGSGDGLGTRAAGAIVLLFGAIAAALGWLP